MARSRHNQAGLYFVGGGIGRFNVVRGSLTGDKINSPRIIVNTKSECLNINDFEARP